MPGGRPRGGRNSLTREVLLDAAEAIMLDEGYPIRALEGERAETASTPVRKR
jgi:hypothetical protein